jgi:hypothetical protein
MPFHSGYPMILVYPDEVKPKEDELDQDELDKKWLRLRLWLGQITSYAGSRTTSYYG